MTKQKITVSFTDEKGKVSSVEREIDIGAINHVDDLEEEVISFTEESASFLMERSIKKKRKWRWMRFWKRIVDMFGTGKKK